MAPKSSGVPQRRMGALHHVVDKLVPVEQVLGHRRIDPARNHGVCGDLVARHFGRKSQHHGDDATLGCRVGLAFCRSLNGCATAGQYQGATFTLLHHLPRCRPQRVKHAVQVDVDDVVPVFVGVFKKRLLVLCTNARVWETGVNAPVTFNDRCHGGFNRVFVGDVTYKRACRRVDCLQFSFGGGVLFGVGTPN